ncbi:MAG: SLC13 family permease [Peptococcaceae bacterium]|nr:SLC13 family permease [Peptococcaceae bacterium]
MSIVRFYWTCSQVIGVFVGVIYGWITLSIGWPSILGLVAFGLTDYVSMSDLLVSAFASQTVVMIMGLLLLAAFIQQAGLTTIIVDFLLSRKSAKGRPYVVLFYFLLAGFIAAILSQPLAVLVIFLELFLEIMKKTDIKPHSRAVPTFFVGSAFAIVIGDISLPFKGCAILGIGAYSSITGENLDFLRYTLFMMPMCLLTIVAYVLFCKFILRINLSGLEDYVHDTSKSATITLRQKVSLVGVILAMAMLLVPSILPDSWAITPIITGLGLGGLTLFLVAILMMIKVEGKPLMDLGEIASQYPWNVYFVIVVLLPLADALSSDAVGLKQLLSAGATSLLSGLPGVLTIFLVVLISAVVTNFANNMVVCSVFVTIICFMGDALPFSTAVMSCLVILATNLSMFFPAANPMNAIIFSQKNIVTFKAEFTHGLISCVFLCVVISVVGFFYGSLIF